jgi:hypothetical protein
MCNAVEKLMQMSYPFMSFLDHQEEKYIFYRIDSEGEEKWRMIMDQHSQSAVINFCILNIVSLPLFLLDTLSLTASSLIILAPPFPDTSLPLAHLRHSLLFCPTLSYLDFYQFQP